MKTGYVERDGVLYIRCYRCGSYIANDRLGWHLSSECSRKARSLPSSTRKTSRQASQTRPPPSGTRRTATQPDQDTQQRKAIHQFCQNRDINLVVHFTRIENLASILRQGLLPRSILERGQRKSGHSFVPADSYRFDGRKNTISLSISFPNYQMFYKCRQETNDESWVVLSLHASLLWELRCTFCPDNAASAGVWSRSLASLQGFSALRDMFAERLVKEGVVIHRSELLISNWFPTDPQAEVLVYEPIPIDYILCVSFFSVDQLKVWLQKHGDEWDGVTFEMNRGLFRKRPGKWPLSSISNDEINSIPF